jgi:ATP-dependent Clp protease ATP-binding subunit ClpB
MSAHQDRSVTDATAKAINEALTIARENANSTAEPIHLAAVLFKEDESIGSRVCTRTEAVDVNKVRRSVQKVLLKKPSQTPACFEASPSSPLSLLLHRATNLSKSNGDALVALDHLMMALYDDRETKDALQEASLTKQICQAAIDEIRGGRKVTSSSAEEQYEALSKYGIDLILLAEEGKLDPVIGRDEEIRRLI